MFSKKRKMFLKHSSLCFLLSNLRGKYLTCLLVYSLNEEQGWNMSQIIPSCQRNSNCCKHKCQGSSYGDAEAIMQHSQRDHCIIISFWMWLPLCVRCLHVRGRRRKGIVSLTVCCSILKGFFNYFLKITCFYAGYSKGFWGTFWPLIPLSTKPFC